MKYLLLLPVVFFAAVIAISIYLQPNSFIGCTETPSEGSGCTEADAVVVEGAGGFHVPLTDTLTGAELAQALALPAVLVVGLRLGCLNHALLTAEAIRARGLTLAGWVANRVDPEMEAVEDNIAYLRARLDAPLLADVPYQELPEPGSLVFDLPKDWQ